MGFSGTEFSVQQTLFSMLIYLFLGGDMLLVLILSMLINKKLRLPLWKIVVYTLIVVPVGVLCAKLMRIIEDGTWVGFSVYGAVLFEPLIMIPLGLLMKIKPVEMMGLGAPTGCLSIVFLKIQCAITGCCYGRILWRQANGRPVRFPSQIVEMIVGIILLFAMMKIIQSERQKKYIYAWFLLLYGSTRFFMNLLRDTEPFVFGISAGCFWSLISCLIGGGVLFYNFWIKEKEGS